MLGCGNIGSVAAKDLAESLPSARIVMADVNLSRAKEAVSRIGLNNVSSIQTDASNHKELADTIKKFDLVVGALPGRMGYRACKASISARVDMVDVSYMPEDVMTLSKGASKAKVCLVPDCGMSPGLDSILAGRAVGKLDQIDKIHILNGGLPKKPIPPLNYVVTWSVKDLIDMYSRKVNIVRDGRVVKVEAMSGLEEITFPGVGKLEAFYTDGLRTMLHTIKGARDMWEKSLRYPGHAEKIKLLKALGFFSEKSIEVGGVQIAPREITARLLENKLKQPEISDIVAMLVQVGGYKNNRETTFTYQCLDRCDKKQKVTALARTTAYTTSIVAQLVVKGAIEEKGLIPPEKLGMNEKLYRKFMDQMEKRGIIVKESKRILH
jgi:lysine 6-dehydrogenase